MAHYFLHLRDDRGELIDPEGAPYATLDHLRNAMLQTARELIAADAVRGEIDLGPRIDAEDSKGRIVHVLTFRSAVTIAGL